MFQYSLLHEPTTQGAEQEKSFPPLLTRYSFNDAIPPVPPPLPTRLPVPTGRPFCGGMPR